MATPETLRQELEAAASNYRIKNPDQWVEDGTGWMRHPAIRGAEDAQLSDAFIIWQGESQYPPKLSDIVKTLAQIAATVPRPAGQAHQCGECLGNRMVEFSMWTPEKHLENSTMKCPVCNKGPAYSVMEDWARSRGATEVIFGRGRNLTARERGVVIPERPKGRVIAVRFTPNAEALDPHRAERKAAEKQLKEEGWR